MKYLLTVYSPESAWTPQQWNRCAQESSQLCHELHARGQYCSASPLQPVATAKTVRVRDGQRLVTDGPFAETTEQLGGYYLIDVANLDEAIAVAARIPPAAVGTVEIRPLVELPELPAGKVPPPDGHAQQVMLLCYDDEAAWQRAGADAQQAAMQQAVGLAHELDARGQYLAAAPLRPSTTATSVRVRQGKRLVSDGPFAETREVLGGFYLLRVAQLSEALEIAARHPGAAAGAVEIRPVRELAGLPPTS